MTSLNTFSKNKTSWEFFITLLIFIIILTVVDFSNRHYNYPKKVNWDMLVIASQARQIGHTDFYYYLADNLDPAITSTVKITLFTVDITLNRGDTVNVQYFQKIPFLKNKASNKEKNKNITKSVNNHSRFFNINFNLLKANFNCLDSIQKN
jgi:hypothetical protein